MKRVNDHQEEASAAIVILKGATNMSLSSLEQDVEVCLMSISRIKRVSARQSPANVAQEKESCIQALLLRR